MTETAVRTFEVADGGDVRELDADTSLTDASRRLPAGAYTTLRTYGGRRVLRLGQHLQRLADSAAGAALAEDRLRAGLQSALERSAHPESRLRVTWAPPRLFVSVELFTALPEALYRDGVACATVSVQRDNPHAKDTRFIATAASAQAALPPGIHEGLLTSMSGAILEGLSSNVFFLKAGALHTEDERALPGVTRSIVLELARRFVPVVLTPVRTDEMGQVAECFLTSVSRGILPVVSIDGQVIGDGAPGTLTRRIGQAFDEMVEHEAERVG
jgi:branched-chain amino acid aminotransferase